ncbi:MAG: 4-(cytidine 5'-diphospho)-2-C-methyl-D-erythritol kinase [Bacteroidales bacterium]|jgi:4-diphosphocytidyl-2-C-methyl-D-erythritol kinase|nr:4-(cytidine 5'-diphospho)-2-C-methyl-D-erythritol kinase [Bacteroidales bacterium]
MLTTIHHKINLGLHIVQKLSSGYHALETVFYPCTNFVDTLEIIPAAHFSFSIKNADFTCPIEENLCVKAYRLLQKKKNLPPVKITLTKQIPSGAGLGGGSADAAYTLKMLNTIFSLGLSIRQLHEFAAQLGSDTPFFIYNAPMYATGRGDILTPIELDLSKYKIEIVCPNFAVSTAKAYSIITSKKPKHTLKNIINAPIETWREILNNDFEEVIFNLHPKLREIKKDFYKQGALYASMSGSGSAIYGIF